MEHVLELKNKLIQFWSKVKGHGSCDLMSPQHNISGTPKGDFITSGSKVRTTLIKSDEKWGHSQNFINLTFTAGYNVPGAALA